MNREILTAFVAAAVVAVAGLPGQARADLFLPPSPEAEQRLRRIRVVALLEPDVSMVELGYSGPDLRPDWDEAARKALSAEVEKALARRGIEVRRIVESPHAPETDEVRALFRSCARVARREPSWEGYELGGNPHQPRGPAAPRAPGLGPLHELAAALGVDAFVLLDARGVNRTATRIFVPQVQPSRERSSTADQLMLGIASRSGDLDWFAWYWSPFGDLRDPDSAARHVEMLLQSFPGKGRGRSPAEESQ